MLIIIIMWNGFRRLAIVIRQENKIVAINHENEEIKLFLYKMVKFNQGL